MYVSIIYNTMSQKVIFYINIENDNVANDTNINDTFDNAMIFYNNK